MSNTTLAIQNLDLEKFVEALREEASASLKIAEANVKNDPIWTARIASAHTLFAIANSLGRGIIYNANQDA